MATVTASGNALGELSRFAELRRRLFFVLFAIMVFRVGSHITIPGIDPTVMLALFEQQRGSILDMFNMFSGGALGRMSIFALGVMPYISSSIIVQLMTHVVPSMEQWRKEGSNGRRKIVRYTRYGTLALASFQAISVAATLQGQQLGAQPLVITPGIGFVFTAAITLVTGVIFLMWLGEQVTERGVGNGISILIFTGIVAGLPSAIGGTLELARVGELATIAVFLLFFLAVAVTAFVVFVERGQRRIPIHYAKRQQGRRMYAAQTSHLPLKLNMAGVIPPIFASSIILFPAIISDMIGQSRGLSWLQQVAAAVSPGQPIYVFLYGGAIVFFCFFYTALVFNSRDIANDLKKAGAFVPSIRPGEQTARYIDNVLTRLTAVGALYITIVCLLPEFLILYFNVPFYFGGTSLLIIVVVVMDFMAQLQSHLMSHQYDSLMKKANFKSIGRGIR